MKDPRTPKLADADSERFRRQAVECILELQALPASTLRVIADVSLADGVATPVRHGLGRAPVFCVPSAPRGATTAGRIDEIRTSADRSESVVLTATGWGATITIDVLVL